MSDSGIYTIVTKATMLIQNDPTYGPRLMHCWLPADTWVEALQKTGHFDAALAIDTRKFNAAFARSGSFGSLMSRFDGSNHTGVFHVRYQHRQYYYFTEEKRQILRELLERLSRTLLDAAEELGGFGISLLGIRRRIKTGTWTMSDGRDRSLSR